MYTKPSAVDKMVKKLHGFIGIMIEAITCLYVDKISERVEDGGITVYGIPTFSEGFAITDGQIVTLGTSTGATIGTATDQVVTFGGRTVFSNGMNIADGKTVTLGTSTGVTLGTATTQLVRFTGAPVFLNGVTVTDGKNIAIGTSTGASIGTGATAKISFFGVTPVVQQAHIADALTTHTGTNVAELAAEVDLDMAKLNTILSRLETFGLVATS